MVAGSDENEEGRREPHYRDDLVEVWHGDCLDVLRAIPDASVDSVVTDPPYGLEFMGKEWDSFRGDAWRSTQGITSTGYTDGGRRLARPSFGGGDSANPTCAGCGGRKRGARRCACAVPDWRVKGKPLSERDNNAAQMRAFQQWCELWAAECLRVLKPGGHLVAFGGTRTVHRLTCAIEDAGFEIRDGIDWLYGSGFPKSLDVSKAIDKAAGRAGVAITALKARLIQLYDASGKTRARIDAECGFRASNYLTLPAEGKRPDPWVNVLPSHAKWQTIKRVIGATTETTVEAELDRFFAAAEREVLGYRAVHAGVAFTSEGPTAVAVTAPATDEAARWAGWGTALKPAREPIVVARKPLAGTVATNVLAYGTGALNIDACRVGDEERTIHAGGASSLSRVSRVGQGYRDTINPSVGEASTVTGRWPSNVLLSHAPLLDAAGEVVGDACAGGCVPGCPVAELDLQSGVLTSGANPARRGSDKIRDAYGDFKGQTECVPARGADSGGASRFFPVFRYQAKAATRERPRAADGVAHPTVKPLALMRWLVRLLTPVGGVVLDPFAGSGTTAEACVEEGFRCITVERDPSYLPLIEARLERQQQRPLSVAV